MLIMIDNYDSFTYNLVHYFKELGQEVRVFTNDEISVEQVQALKPQAIVISPGPGRPEQAGISLALIDAVLGKIPLLGVCLGHQAIAQAFGARIVLADHVMHGKTSKVYHHQHGLFEALPHPLQVTRYHSLVVDPRSLPAAFDVTAWTQDAGGDSSTIMAIQHRHLPIYGVQFHPESVLTEYGHQLLQRFLQLTGCDVAHAAVV